MPKPQDKIKKADQLEFPDGTIYNPPVDVQDPNLIRSAHFWKNLNQLGYMMAIAIMVGVIPGAMILQSNQQPGQKLEAYPVTAQTPEEVCTQSQGEWKEYGNSCADTCAQYSQEQLCDQETTFSCDCGSNSCWSGEECVSNPNPTFMSNTDKQTDEL